MAKKFSSRKFLNKNEGHAAIQTKAIVYDATTGYGSAAISDCTKTIKLELDYETKEARTLSEYKLRTLIEELQKLQKRMYL